MVSRQTDPIRVIDRPLMQYSLIVAPPVSGTARSQPCRNGSELTFR
jgi:hypothetical protein